jgi:hypothetical protein
MVFANSSECRGTSLIKTPINKEENQEEGKEHYKIENKTYPKFIL